MDFCDGIDEKKMSNLDSFGLSINDFSPLIVILGCHPYDGHTS